MPGSKTAYLEAALLNFVFNGAAFVPPSTLYVALSVYSFFTDATGSSMGEVPIDSGGSSTGYSRVSTAMNTTNWPTASGSNPAAIANAVAITFGEAFVDWGVIKSAYLVDASSDGNTFYGADLGDWRTVLVGSSFEIGAGSAVFQET